MFCLIYFSDKPNVLEISQTKTTLIQRLVDKSIQQCIDEVGQKNFVNTLEVSGNILDVSYPMFPNFALKKCSEDKIEVHRVEKKQVVEKGYIYNTTKDVVESFLVGTYYVVPVENWKYDDLPQRPEEEKRYMIRPFEARYFTGTRRPTMLNMSSIQSMPIHSRVKTEMRPYDKVLLELIESIQKRKVD